MFKKEDKELVRIDDMRPRYHVWKKLPYWKLFEALYLISDIEPSYVMDSHELTYMFQFDKEAMFDYSQHMAIGSRFIDLNAIAERYNSIGELYSEAPPIHYIEWAINTKVDDYLADEFRQLVVEEKEKEDKEKTARSGTR